MHAAVPRSPNVLSLTRPLPPCSPRPRPQKYYNVRASYINAFYSVINWRGVSALYGKAVQGARAFARVDVLQPAANWD